jgi:hypothetical protein
MSIASPFRRLNRKVDSPQGWWNPSQAATGKVSIFSVAVPQSPGRPELALEATSACGRRPVALNYNAAEPERERGRQHGAPPRSLSARASFTLSPHTVSPAPPG